MDRKPTAREALLLVALVVGIYFACRFLPVPRLGPASSNGQAEPAIVSARPPRPAATRAKPNRTAPSAKSATDSLTAEEQQRLAYSVGLLEQSFRRVESANTYSFDSGSARGVVIAAPTQNQLHQLYQQIEVMLQTFEGSPAAYSAAKVAAENLLAEYTEPASPYLGVVETGLNGDQPQIVTASMRSLDDLKVDPSGDDIEISGDTTAVRPWNQEMEDRYGYLLNPGMPYRDSP